MSETAQDYWRIEVEIDIEFDEESGFYFTIEELGLLDADFDEWLSSLPEEDDDGDGEGYDSEGDEN